MTQSSSSNESRSEKRTFHVHALFLPEGSTELLDFCGKASLYIFCGQGMMMMMGSTRSRRRKGVFWRRADLLNQGMGVTKLLR